MSMRSRTSMSIAVTAWSLGEESARALAWAITIARTSSSRACLTTLGGWTAPPLSMVRWFSPRVGVRLVGAVAGVIRYPLLEPGFYCDPTHRFSRILLPCLYHFVLSHPPQTFASHVVMSGLDVYTVGRLLGYADTGSTERYAYLSDEHVREAAGRIFENVGSACFTSFIPLPVLRYVGADRTLRVRNPRSGSRRASWPFL